MNVKAWIQVNKKRTSIKPEVRVYSVLQVQTVRIPHTFWLFYQIGLQVKNLVVRVLPQNITQTRVDADLEWGPTVQCHANVQCHVVQCHFCTMSGSTKLQCHSCTMSFSFKIVPDLDVGPPYNPSVFCFASENCHPYKFFILPI